MSLQLIARGPQISSAAAAKRLPKHQQAQLLVALAAYLGKKTPFAKAFPRDEPVFAQRYEVVDARAPTVVLYDLWELGGDSGDLFLPGEAKSAGVELVQGSFGVRADVADEGALGELVLALGEAERLPDPDAPYLFEPGEFEDSRGVRAIRRIAGFRTEEAIPKTKRAWDQLLTWPDLYVTEAFAVRYAPQFTHHNWVMVCTYSPLSEAFLREHHTQLGWQNIGFYQKLSEAFIHEFADQLVWKGWQGICSRQVLSESFLREHAERVDWSTVARYQSISETFIEEFADRFDEGAWQLLVELEKLSPAAAQRLAEGARLRREAGERDR